MSDLTRQIELNRIYVNCLSNEDNAYFFVNTYGDDTAEIICNTQSGDGAERVAIYRNNDGIIEMGFVKESYICNEFGIVKLESPGSIKEFYDSERNLIVVILCESDSNESEVSTEIQTNMEDAFEFLEYEYIE